MKQIFRLLITSGFLITVAQVAKAQTCPTLTTLTNGTAADANAVMGNFNTILNCTNNSIVGASAVSGGNVGIGTTTPSQKLSVAGTIQSMSGGVQFPDGTIQSTAGGAVSGGLINKFRNGTMDVWQRGTASMTVTTSGAYTADGWFVFPAGASVAVAAAAGIDYTVNSLQITGATNVTDVMLKQPIESYISAPFYNQSVTVQFKFVNNTGNPVTPALTVRIPSAQDNYASSTLWVSAVSLQACAVAATCTEAYTFTGSASSNLGTEIDIDFGNNFSTNAKSVKVADLDIRVTPGVTIGLNSNSPPPEFRPVGTELSLCQRYLEAMFADTDTIGVISYPSNGNYWFSWFFKAQKRSAPIFNLFGTWSNGTPSIYPSTDHMTFTAGTNFYLVATAGALAALASAEIAP